MKGLMESRKILAIVLALGTTTTVLAGTAAAAKWEIETVDPTATGRCTSLKIDKFGDAHVAYVAEDGSDSLRYAFWDHSIKRWFTMTVSAHADFSSIALDSKQHPHISYVDHGSMHGSKLEYAYWDGTSWKKQAIPVNSGSIAYYTSIALDAKDNPIISFYDHLTPEGDFAIRLRTVAWNGSYWESRTVDEDWGSGKFNAIALDSKGHPHIAYANVRAETAGLRYARWDGQSWNLEIIEGGRGRARSVYSVSMLLDKDDVPHITYTDVANSRVKYATRRGGSWQVEVVDVLAKVSYPDRNGIALDAQGQPYISYYDSGRGDLKIAFRRGQKWYGEIVDQNFSGFTSSLQIDHDAIWVTYADQVAGALKCARSSLEQAAVSQERPVITPK